MRWQKRANFFAVSARLMRHVLVDTARSKGYQKRGGGAQKVSLDEALVVSDQPGDDFVAVDDALKVLEAVDARKCQVVELRFFGGLTVDETAEVLHVSAETVMRDWQFAKGRLLRELRGGTS
jgi:RNA polymerase sigma-70 factor (ECF subfamily)